MGRTSSGWDDDDEGGGGGRRNAEKKSMVGAHTASFGLLLEVELEVEVVKGVGMLSLSPSDAVVVVAMLKKEGEMVGSDLGGRLSLSPLDFTTTPSSLPLSASLSLQISICPVVDVTMINFPPLQNTTDPTFSPSGTASTGSLLVGLNTSRDTLP